MGKKWAPIEFIGAYAKPIIVDTIIRELLIKFKVEFWNGASDDAEYWQTSSTWRSVNRINAENITDKCTKYRLWIGG